MLAKRETEGREVTCREEAVGLLEAQFSSTGRRRQSQEEAWTGRRVWSDRKDAMTISRWASYLGTGVPGICKKSEDDFSVSVVFLLASNTISAWDCCKSLERGDKSG